MNQHQVLVVGHADADGHLITEQVRRNLAQIEAFNVSAFVDPARTKDHRAWFNLDAITEIEQADLVFFVDLMFGPDSYAEEATALTHFVEARPAKRFFLIDHHPVPFQRLEVARNLRAAYRPEVSDCAIGPRSGMMVIAALCEHQNAEVATVKTHLHADLCLAMRRASAIGGPIAGTKLLALLEANLWSDLLRLSKENPKFHRLPRGLRSSSTPQSEVLNELDRTATELLSQGKEKEDFTMSYDATGVAHEQLAFTGGERILKKKEESSPKDLGVIVTLLEVAALSLTPKQGKKFTFDELIGEARSIGGKDLDTKDVKTVLKKARFVKKDGGKYSLR